MHTSTILAADDFYFGDLTSKTAIPFEAWCPDYSPRDRVAVVCRTTAEGVSATARTLLALTTSFYDSWRSTGAPFFDYPQHFALVEAHDAVDSDRGAAWSTLDVWPDSQRIAVEGGVDAMLGAVSRLHINRLLWPEGWTANAVAGTKRPAYESKLLRSRLRSVWMYGSSRPDIEVSGNKKVAALVEKSVAALADKPALPAADTYRRCAVDRFVQDMADCFAD